ncbi:hypothetical protein BD0036_05240 [Helicobacter pylori]
MITNTPLKIFIGFIKCVGMSEIMINSINRCISKIFAQQNLKLTAKKLKSLKSKDFKKVMVFKKDSPNTRQSDRELKA